MFSESLQRKNENLKEKIDWIKDQLNVREKPALNLTKPMPESDLVTVSLAVASGNHVCTSKYGHLRSVWAVLLTPREESSSPQGSWAASLLDGLILS